MGIVVLLNSGASESTIEGSKRTDNGEIMKWERV